MAAENGHKDVLKALIEAGADIDGLARDKQTPLMIAAKMGHLDCVKFLIESKANILARDNRHLSALHYGLNKQNNND